MKTVNTATRRWRGTVGVATITVVAVTAALLAGLQSASAEGALGAQPRTDRGTAVQRAWVAFKVPGKVECVIEQTPDGSAAARCSALGATYEGPPANDDCHAAWGSTVGMASHTPPHFQCIGEALPQGDALGAGETRSLDDIVCTALADGMSCRRGTNGPGFELTPYSWNWLPPNGKKLIASGRVGGIKVGLTLSQAKKRGAIRRTKSQFGCRGDASHQLRSKYQGAYVVWRRNRVHSIVGWSNARVLTRQGVGIGSSYAQARRAYPDAATKRVSFPYSPATALVVRQGKNALWMIFSHRSNVVDLPQLWAGTRMDLMVTTRKWHPRMRLDYHGCGYGA